MLTNRKAYLLFAAALGAVLIFPGDADAQLFKRRAARKAARVQIPTSVPRTQCVDADGDGLDDRTGQPCVPGPGAGPVTREEFGGRPGYIDPGTGAIVAAPPTTVRAQHVDANGDGICDGCGASLSAETSDVPVGAESIDDDDGAALSAAQSDELAKKSAYEDAIIARKIEAINRKAALDARDLLLEAQRKAAAIKRNTSRKALIDDKAHAASLSPTVAETTEEASQCEDCELGE